MLGQFARRCFVYWLHLKTAFTVYLWEVLTVGWLSLSFIGAKHSKCETLVLANCQPPTSPPLTLRKALNITLDKLPVPIYRPRQDVEMDTLVS